jgi:hypothetical protein
MALLAHTTKKGTFNHAMWRCASRPLKQRSFTWLHGRLYADFFLGSSSPNIRGYQIDYPGRFGEPLYFNCHVQPLVLLVNTDRSSIIDVGRYKFATDLYMLSLNISVSPIL